MSWILAFVGFAMLVVLHELGHFAVAKWVGMRVEKFSLFFPPTIASRKVGETEYAIGAIPAGGYVKISGMNPDEDLPAEVRDRAYHAQPVWKRISVIAAGPAMNLILALALLVVFFVFVGGTTASDRVGRFDEGYPAVAKLERGDRILAVDGVRGEPERLIEQVASHKCAGKAIDRCRARTPARLSIERDGQRQELDVRPVYDATTQRTRLGFGYAEGPRDTLPFGAAVTTSLDRFWLLTKRTVSLPARLFDTERRKEISGVVGSYEVTRQTIVANVADALAILAVISLSLAIVNLFPFLPLDGGHIFWAIVEKVRGKPVPLVLMERSGVIGFMLVIGVFLIGLSNDIGRLQGDGFGVR